MPKVDGVGYSETTPTKIKILGSIFGMHQAITQAVLEKHPRYPRMYRYVDLTSGKGVSPDGTNGSPTVFLENASKLRIPFQADFIERKVKNIEELRLAIAQRGWDDENLSYHSCDYRIKIREILPAVNEYELGLAFVDPSGDLPDFDTLRYIAETRPRMEILIYISSTNVKRVNPYTQKVLADHIRNIPKNKWLISTPSRGDKFKWIFLLASNSDLFKNYKRIGFFRLDSENGEDLFERVNLTLTQRTKLKQPPLFE